jgi:uncharacterized protein DUF6353
VNLKSLKNAVTSRVGRQLLTANKHSPKILFAAGIVGFGVTVVLASRATLKLDEILDKHSDGVDAAKTLKAREVEEYTEQDYRKDLVVIHTQLLVRLAKVYGPAVVMGLASVAALTGSHVVLNRRYLGVTAAYAGIEKAYNEYRKRVAAEFGEEKETELRLGLVEKEIVDEDENGTVVKTVKGLVGKHTTSPYAVFFDESSSNWNREWGYNQMFLRCQQNWLNDLLNARGHVFLNEVYEALGLPHTKAGAVVGWIKPDNCQDECGDGYIDFGVFRAGGEWKGLHFINGNERSILLDFNVDGVIYDKI